MHGINTRLVQMDLLFVSMNRLALVATAGLLLTGCGGTTLSPAITGQPVHTVTVTQPTTATSTYIAAPQPTATPTGPKLTIDTDGTYLVGTDILPGVYRTTGGFGGSNCYWARLNSLNTSDIINNNNSSGPQVVEILSSDRAFLTENCEPWKLASAAPSAAVAAPPVSQGGALTSLPGADVQGFSDSPRCSYQAALMVRTALSQAVVCDEGNGTYTYKGLRLKDQGRVDVPGALPTANGFTATNGDTRYDISHSGIVITTGGNVYTEQALASGP
jgi:hypothetical protein